MLTRDLLFLSALTLAAFACKNDPATTDTRLVENMAVSDSTLTTNFMDTLSGCYLMVKNRDTAFLNIKSDRKKITGTLDYNLYEKDSNKGEINGNIQDSLIRAYYKFNSEGMSSVREVVFKIKAGQLIEGMGTVFVRNDSAFFLKDSTGFRFAEDQPFVKVPCK